MDFSELFNHDSQEDEKCGSEQQISSQIRFQNPETGDSHRNLRILMK